MPDRQDSFPDETAPDRLAAASRSDENPPCLSHLETQAAGAAEYVHQGMSLPDRPGVTYAAHLAQVARLVARSGGTREERAAAWLHHAAREAVFPADQIALWYGPRVAELVEVISLVTAAAEGPASGLDVFLAGSIEGADEGVRRLVLCDQIAEVQSYAAARPMRLTREQYLGRLDRARRVAEACGPVSPLLLEILTGALAAAEAACPSRTH